MPQDSTYVINNPGDTISLPDSARDFAKPEIVQQLSNRDVNKSHYASGPLLFITISLLVVTGPVWVRLIKRKWMDKKVEKDFNDKYVEYDNLLSRYNPYYKSLDIQLRERFMRRVLRFMKSKDFNYIGIEAEEKMPLLISATAVQLTFGLDNYLLDYFKNIYVLEDNYRYGLYNVPFEGHVSDDGIYLSWSNFMREFNDYNDGQNLGLHEMSHALTYVNFTAGKGVDHLFHDKFSEFSKVARPVFEKMQNEEIILLNNYASTNYQEFWAVCIETFFERSASFREQLPDLYFSLCNLLNQDPLTAEKVLAIIET